MKEIKLCDKVIMSIYNKLAIEKKAKKIIVSSMPTKGVWLDNSFYNLDDLIALTNEYMKDKGFKIIK